MTSDMPLFARTYPDAPATGTTDTSEAAAEKIAPVADNWRARVLSVIRDMGDFGATADEVAIRLRADVLTIRPRVTELGEQGKIERTTARRKNAKGNSQIVWRATCKPTS